MTSDCLHMLQRLESGSSGRVDADVRQLLEDAGTRKVTSSGTGATVHETALVWRTRYELNKDTNHPLHGALELLAELHKLTPQRKVEQSGFIGEQFTCILFFDWSTSRFLGFVLVRRRTLAEEEARSGKQKRLQHRAGMQVDAHPQSPKDEVPVFVASH